MKKFFRISCMLVLTISCMLVLTISGLAQTPTGADTTLVSAGPGETPVGGGISEVNTLDVERLDNVGIAVRDIRTMYTFYTQVLGMKAPPLQDIDTQFFGRVGSTWFYVFQTSGTGQQGRSVENYLADPPGYDHLVFAVDDIETAVAQLEANGIRCQARGELPGVLGGHFCRFQDPEGNLVGLLQHVNQLIGLLQHVNQ